MFATFTGCVESGNTGRMSRPIFCYFHVCSTKNWDSGLVSSNLALCTSYYIRLLRCSGQLCIPFESVEALVRYSVLALTEDIQQLFKACDPSKGENRGAMWRFALSTVKIIRRVDALSLTFICPCIGSISLKYNQQDATFSRSIYFYKFLYMFQAVPLPIIRSTKAYIQRQVLSNQYCCLPQQAAVLVWQYLTLYVHFCAPDDGQRNRLKHVEQFIEINRSRKRCILLVVL